MLNVLKNALALTTPAKLVRPSPANPLNAT
jgi:hypothetical protein